MQLSGEYTFRAPIEDVWQALLDPGVLQQALPGGEQMERVGENEYAAIMNVRVGPVQGRFEGRVELSDIAPLQSYRMKVSGQGTPGFLNGEGTLQLEAARTATGEEGALLRYSGDVQVGGKIANVGQRVIESSARSLTRQGLQALERQILAAHAHLEATPFAQEVPLAARAPLPAALPEPVLPPQAPAEAAPVWQPVRTPRSAAAPVPQPSGAAGIMLTTLRDVAGDLASDYLTPRGQERLAWAGLGALAMLFFVILVRLVQKR